MKKLLLIAASFFLFASFFTSCKKDEAPPIAKDKLYGTWKLDSMVTTTFDGSSTISNTTKNSGYYIKLDELGSAEINMDGNKRLATYTRKGDSEIAIEGAVFTISNFTENTMKLYNKTLDGNKWGEISMWLIK